jgi:endonuclease YncB( thermonuclease family)
MGKLIILGIAIFFIVGILMEAMIDNVFSPEAEAEFNRSADQFIAAQREGEAITANTQPGGRKSRKPLNRQLARSDCDAANINSFNSHPPMTGIVTDVTDGDTLKATVDGVEMKIRLWGIDSPEMNQQYGAEARQHLESMTPPGSRVTIHPLSMDQYGRVVGNVGDDSEWSVNFLMIAQGWAYHYKEFSAMGNPCFIEAERIAQDNRMGVWRNGAQGGKRPWDHRRQRPQQLEQNPT